MLHGGHCQGERTAAQAQLVATLRVMLAHSGEVWLENAAGQGQELATTWPELARILGDVQSRRLGILLDTAHVMATGQPLATADDVDHLWRTLRQSIGLDRIKAIHLNDLAAPVGSRRDRHAHLLEGQMGTDALASILHMASRRDWVVILETPGRGIEHNARAFPFLGASQEGGQAGGGLLAALRGFSFVPWAST